MRISRKYPLFLLLTTIGTAAAVFFAVLGILRSSIERELTKRGEAAAHNFALANAPRILASELDKVQYNLGALGSDPDIIAARVANHNGKIVASLDPEDVGKKLPKKFRRTHTMTFSDRKEHAYHFLAKVRYGNVDLGVFVLSLSSTPLEAAVARARTRSMWFSAAIAALISIFALLLVQREVRPLQEMGVALEAISRGDFTQRVPKYRNDEIGQLATAFNHMLKRAEIFFHYVDKMIIERLVEDESLTRPGGRERDIAVVFGDMRGYTAMSNRRTADNVVRIVNTFFHLFVECIAYFQGVVDKTMGDAIMAVFEGREGEAGNAYARRGAMATAYMKAASRILNAFLTQRPDLAEPLEIEAKEFGFSIATGKAIVGNIGSRRRMDYTVCGRVVNLASRLEGLTKRGEVILDNFTHMAVSDAVQVEPLPAVQPKGFSEAEQVVPHRLVSLSVDEDRKLRKYMQVLFSYSFVHEVLMPETLPSDVQHKWCHDVHRMFEKLIEDLPHNAFFDPIEIRAESPFAGTVIAGGKIAMAPDPAAPPRRS